MSYRSPLRPMTLTVACVWYAAMGGALFATTEEKPLTPSEARERVGEKIELQMEVRVAKDRLEKRGEIYLDSEEDFRDEKNFAVVVTKQGAESLRAQEIRDPAAHFQGKLIRVRGTVKEVDGVPRIEVDDADQIKLEKSP